MRLILRMDQTHLIKMVKEETGTRTENPFPPQPRVSPCAGFGGEVRERGWQPRHFENIASI